MRRLSAALVFLLAGTVAADTNWPQFRGSQSGRAEGRYPETWSTTENVVWKTAIPGSGWSSPVVWGDKVFVTAVVTDGKPAPPRKGLYIQDLTGRTPPGVHRWMVYCLDWSTGKILWEKKAHEGTPPGTRHVKNTYASETPVTDGERVYASFGNLGVFCYDSGGKELWSRKWPARKTRMGWGTAASPVLHGGRLYVVNDNEEDSFLAALDVKTGREVWRVGRKEKSNWATPLVWRNDKRTEIVTAGSGRVRSYGLDGQLLWELAGMSTISIPTPSAAHGLCYVSSGYVADWRRPVYAIRPGGSGDISLKGNETANASIAWCQKLAGPYHPSPVVAGDYLYVLLDRGLLSCYDARTGKEVYQRERLPGGTAFTASPLAADGKVYCLSEDGDTFVVQAGPRFKLLARNRLDEMCLATPAAVRGSLLVRTASRLYRIGAKQGGQ